jgi:hypothetical protein
MCVKEKTRPNGQFKMYFDDNTLRALIEAIIVGVPGSEFYHSSQTSLGFVLDSLGLELNPLIVLQGALNSSGIPYDPILYDVSEQPANRTGVELAAAAANIIINDDVNVWREKLEKVRPRK